MDPNLPGPSRAKKQKVSFKDPNNVTDEELLAVLEASDSEIDELLGISDSDDEYILEGGCESEESDYDDGEGRNFVFLFVYSYIAYFLVDAVLQTQLPQTHTQPSTLASGSIIPTWSSNPTALKVFPFTKRNELLQLIPGNNEPIDYFRAIFDNNILELIVRETNNYAETVFLAVGTTEKSRITRWKPVTSAEMLTFVGSLLHTGTIRTNRLQDYWKRHPLFNLQSFSKHMSRDRFLLIMRCLHFAENGPAGVPTDRLHKINPFLNFFNEKMAVLYYPQRELSLDESMVLWRGRLVFRQYIKNKKHKYGIKLYVLTEPCGVILKVLIYTRAMDNLGGKGHTTKVVLDLMRNYLDSGHSLYLDNFYNSFELANELTNRRTYCTGTLNAKRKNNPKAVIDKKLKKGEITGQYSNDIIVGKWKDKREVLYISNEYENNMIEYTDRQNRAREKPTPIYYYNKFMGGVDHQDQLSAYYPCERKSLRWYKQLGIHLIHLM
nr:piggyBac transposable element-derived protein 4-like [Leptinotarsa decemlineata]